MKVLQMAIAAMVVTVVLTSCGDTNDPVEAAGNTDGVLTSDVVTRFDVVSKLRPLTAAVVEYTDTDYAQGSTSPYSEAVLSSARSNLINVESEERRWLAFTSAIDYEASALPGLEEAIDGYNAALDAWQAGQVTGLRTWDKCLGDYEDEFLISACMLSEYNMDDEKPLLDQYIGAIKQLFVVLGVPNE